MGREKVSGVKDSRKRKVAQLVEMLQADDRLIVPEIFQLARSILAELQADNMGDERRWMNSKQAADYCGVPGRRYVLRLVKIHSIPRYGHSKRMFDRYELDQWMVDSKCFLPDQAGGDPRGVPCDPR